MFLKGLILGLSIAIPVGPIGLLCLQRTLARGRLHGFVSGLGAATADAIYGLVAALGLRALTSFLIGFQFWLQLGGGIFLLGLGIKILLSKPAQRATGPEDRGGLLPAYLSILALTLANPATILSFLAVFAGLGIGAQTGSLTSAALLVAGVFLGSTLWWLALSFLANLLRRHLNDGRTRIVNFIAGLSILGLGLWSMWPVLQHRLVAP